MNNLKLFNFNNNQVRTVLIKNEPYFVGKDVAQILGYQNGSRDINRHVDREDRQNYQNGTFESNRGLTVINESGLYSLILSSKLPQAKEFKRWVTSEVLPAIRQNGAYLTDQKAFEITHNPNSLADLLLQAGEQLKQKDLQITEMKPKALFADAVAVSHSSILIGELAKIMKQNGIDIGQNRLFEWLRVNHYLISGNRSDKNMPTQKSLDLQLFKIKETVINHSDGHTTINKTPKVTGKGQQYFITKFLEAE